MSNSTKDKYQTLEISSVSINRITNGIGECLVSDRLRMKRYINKHCDPLKEYKLLFNYLDFTGVSTDTYIDSVKNDIKKCIFCLKTEPDVSFNTRPHVIPEFLGNRYLLHHNECDSCNEIFGVTCEREMSEYVRSFRMLDRIKSKKKKYISYRSINQESSFEFEPNESIYKVITRDEMTINEEKNEFTYDFEIPLHTPVNVYKGFMKIFYALLPETHRENFSLLHKWLVSDDVKEILIQPLVMAFTFLPYMNKKPLMITILYKKNKELGRVENWYTKDK